MSNETFHIPKHGGAGPSFLGVEFKDTYIVLLSVFIAIPAGKLFGVMAYMGIPFAGYHINKQYMEWKGNNLPGFFRAFLFRAGLKGYSKGFKSQKVVFIGDGAVISPGNRRLLSTPAEEEA